ncbi:hypothetical protein AVEN_19447-1 [Araneus ventricosus]|uniref:Uncharacterized protein n=1 Tax=Araneus ventricosus TaxID=182803 RepID=A0A4Y2C718_ARAVE|nr:hypothetical protein AVEN_19447-1 [Araneus ventricosus]
MTRTTPEPAPPIPNFITSPAGGRVSHEVRFGVRQVHKTSPEPKPRPYHFALRPDSRDKYLRFAVWMSMRRNFIEQKNGGYIQCFNIDGKHVKIIKTIKNVCLQMKRKTRDTKTILRQVPKVRCIYILVGGLNRVLVIEPLEGLSPNV